MFEAKLQKGAFDSLDSMLAALSLIEACDDSTAREARMAACAVANDCLFSLLPTLPSCVCRHARTQILVARNICMSQKPLSSSAFHISHPW